MLPVTLIRLTVRDWLEIDYLLHDVLEVSANISHQEKCRYIAEIVDYIILNNLEFDYNSWDTFHKAIFKLGI